MSKFKVGDIVRGISDRYMITNRCMTKGKVTNVYDSLIYGMEVEVLEHTLNHCIGKTFPVRSCDFELVDEPQNWKVVIVPDGEVTTAMLYENNQVVKRVTTKKHPSDEYSRKVACDTLVERLFEKKVEPKYYNGEVVCVDASECPGNLTVGKIYKFVNGMCCSDRGIQILSSPTSSVSELNSRLSPLKFIEVVH